MTAAVISPAQAAPQPVRPAATATRRDWPTLLFLAASLGLSMSVSQEYTGEQTQTQYLMFLLPAIVVSVMRPLALFHAMSTKAGILVAMLLIGGTWHALTGDMQAVFVLGLIVLVYTWHNAPPVRLVREDVQLLYALMVVVGFVVWLTTDINRWGPIPGTTVVEYGIWRVSFFPNISFSAFFSLGVVMLTTMDGWKSASRNWIFWLALYFLVFSFVRTAVVGLAIYIFLQWLLRRHWQPSSMFLMALFVGFGVNLLIAYSAVLFAQFQDIELVSRLFLRGETGLSVFEIYQQLYRPWLWGQHFAQFATSPYLMGWGSTEFMTLVTDQYVASLELGDSVSMPTRVLAQYGVPGSLFSIYLLVCLAERARHLDTGSCSVWPVVFLAILQWGSLFHPTDGLGFRLMLMIVKGREGFPVRSLASRAG